MGKRRRGTRNPNRNVKGWQIAVASAAAVVTAVLVVGALMQDAANRDAAATATAERTPRTIAMPVQETPERIQLADVLPRLKDPARPFNVVVFSDSTGAGRETWTALTGEWLGEKYDRTVEGVQWDIHEQPNGYRGSKWNLAKGQGELVQWWNGASSGKDAVYSLENIDAIAPIPAETVDLVFVNHGHNHARNELVTEVADLVREADTRYSNAAIVVVLQNPEDSRSPHGATQKQEVAELRGWTSRNGFPVIDIWSAFEAQDVDALLDETLYHPTPEGYQFWADEVTKVLDAADPT